MSRFLLKPFRFDIRITHTCRFSSKNKSHVLAASRACLNAIPKALLRKHLKPIFEYQLHISFVTAPQIQRLNLKYRNKNRPTDVLSFSRISGPALPIPQPDLGDVIICRSIALSQARDFNISEREEIQRLTIHGILHLFGYDHEKSPLQEKLMFALQEKILRLLK